MLDAFLGLYGSIDSCCCCGFSILSVGATVRTDYSIYQRPLLDRQQKLSAPRSQQQRDS